MCLPSETKGQCAQTLAFEDVLLLLSQSPVNKQGTISTNELRNFEYCCQTESK
jgi:hypothetical protein